jgi:hypothetical protein
MLQKFLLIGVGGSGGKTLRYTWRELHRRLDANKWTGGVPQAWRFLHIDLPDRPDIEGGDIPVVAGGAHAYLGLGEPDRDYRAYDDDLAGKSDLLPSVAGWRPDPTLDYSPPWMGAGQRRVVGRIVTLARLGDVARAVDAEIDTLNDNDVEEELRELGRHLEQGDVGKPKANVIVVASLGGGAGSGGVLDVVELLRRRTTEQAQWLEDTLMTVLYGPDVFDSLRNHEKLGVQPNSLAAVSELISAFEHEQAVPETELTLLRLGGAVVPREGRRSARFNFLVGAKNGSLGYGNPNQVFRAVGKTLSTIVFDEPVRTQLQQKTWANWGALAVQDDFRLTRPGREGLPFSSMGYASVSLGRQLFEQYAIERMAKRAVERLVRGHREHFPGDPRTDEAIVAARADQIDELFFDATKLRELDEDEKHNQVIDAFREKNEAKAKLDEIVDEVSAKLRGEAKERSPREWLDRISGLFQSKAAEYEKWAAEQSYGRMREWVLPAQHRLLEVTAQYAGEEGLPVTLELLERLERQLIAAAAQLDRDSHSLRDLVSSASRHGAQLIDKIREKLVTPEHPHFASAAEERRKNLRRSADAELYEFTAGILRELARDFVPAVRASLAGALAALVQARDGHERRLLAKWSASTVPNHLRPAPNELLLEDEEGFPEALEGLLAGMFGFTSADDAESAALREIISGAWPPADHPGKPSPQSLVRLEREWRPSLLGGRPARTTAHLTPSGIFTASQNWVRGREGGLSLHISETLAAWLKPDDQGLRASRSALFADRIDQALRNAAPLVSINADAYRRVHGGSLPQPSLVSSPIPLDEKHEARERVQRSLEAAGVKREAMESMFHPTSERTEVEFTTFLAASMHPVVFDSLTSPMLESWNQQTGAGARASWWQFRRSRPLPAFVPVSRSRQVAMIRGWLTADMLGQVPVLGSSWSDAPLSIWTRAGRRSFPPRLLGGEVREHGAVIAALLESLPLALLHYSTGAEEHLNAYLRLIELGSSRLDPDGGIYGELNGELADWISLGRLAEPEPGNEPAPEPPSELAGSADQTPQERSALLLATLEQFLADFRRDVEGLRLSDQQSLRMPRTWELRHEITHAATELINALSAAGSQPAGGSGRMRPSAT